MKTKVLVISIILVSALIGSVFADEPIINSGVAITTDPTLVPTSTFSFSYKIPNSSIKVGWAGINTTPIFIDYSYTNMIPNNGVKMYDDSINQTWIVSKDKSNNGHYQVVTVNSNAPGSNGGWFSWV